MPGNPKTPGPKTPARATTPGTGQRHRTPKPETPSKRGAVVPIEKQGTLNERAQLQGVKADLSHRVSLVDFGLQHIDGLPEIPKLEYLYLRNNYLTNLLGFPFLGNLKVLDLSHNRLTELRGFPTLPSLTQLFLNDNALGNLIELPELASLEVLSVSHNSIKSFVGTREQPSLQFLFASNNPVADFCGLAIQPELMEITLDGTPVSESPDYRLCLVAACNDALDRIDGEEISADELKRRNALKGKVVECLRLGMVLEDGDGDDDARLDAQVETFITTLNKLQTADALVQFESMSMTGEAVEDKELVANFTFSGDKQPDTLLYQWYASDRDGFFFPIMSARTNTYKPTYDDYLCTLKVECVAVVDGQVAATAFHLSDNVEVGTPTFHDVTLDNDAREGQILRIYTRYTGGIEGRSRYKWYRIPEHGIPELVHDDDVNYVEYPLQWEDINCQIRVEATPVNEKDEEGETVTYTTESLIQPADGEIPKIRQLQIRGTLMEGEDVQAVTVFANEGQAVQSRYDWFRVSPATDGAQGGPELTRIDNADGTGGTINLSIHDIGCSLRVEATPFRDDGLTGTPFAATTPESTPIIPAAPHALSFEVWGNLSEGSTLRTKYVYFGGVEGEHEYRWYRTSQAGETSIVHEQHGATYELTPDDVSYVITAEFVPVRSDGAKGDPVVAATRHPIHGGHPTAAKVQIVGTPTEKETLKCKVVYQGGAEGPSTYQWFRVSPVTGSKAVPIFKADKHWYTLTADDVGHLIRVEYTPIRDDGVTGDSVAVQTLGATEAAAPTASGFKLLGDATEKHTLTASAFYSGGHEGDSKYEWFRVTQAGNGDAWPIKDAHGPRLLLRRADVGCVVRCRYTPVRDDGVVGEPVSAVSDVVDAGSDPQFPIGTVAIAGDVKEGATITAATTYDGGVESPTESVFTWYRHAPGLSPTVIVGATGKTLRLSAADVGHKIRVEYTPVRNDGVAGDAVVCTTNELVAKSDVPLPVGTVTLRGPEAATGNNIVTAVTTYQSAAGRAEGESQYRWYRCPPNEKPVLIETARSNRLLVSRADLGAVIFCEYTPVDVTGLAGETVSATTSAPVNSLAASGSPSGRSPLHHSAHPRHGGPLQQPRVVSSSPVARGTPPQAQPLHARQSAGYPSPYAGAAGSPYAAAISRSPYSSPYGSPFGGRATYHR